MVISFVSSFSVEDNGEFVNYLTLGRCIPIAPNAHLY